MVTIVDYKACQNEDGTDFLALVVQGGLEAVKSKETGRAYFTARKASVPCTFDQETCKSLIGSELDGRIKKTLVDPYGFVIPDTGEEIMLSHSYEYISELDEMPQQEHNKLEIAA